MFKQCIAGLTVENDGEREAASASDYEAVEVSEGAFNAVTMSGAVRF